MSGCAHYAFQPRVEPAGTYGSTRELNLTARDLDVPQGSVKVVINSLPEGLRFNDGVFSVDPSAPFEIVGTVTTQLDPGATTLTAIGLPYRYDESENGSGRTAASRFRLVS